MALVYNNLLINKNSKKYRPFLLNLISGRRRLLSDEEFQLICSIIDSRASSTVSNAAKTLTNKLCDENQFVTDEDKANIELKLQEAGHFDINDQQANDFSFSIELTQSCNMDCSFCYVRSRIGSGLKMSKKHIDAIHGFYTKYTNEQKKVIDTSIIRITGGEPLISNESVDIINYVTDVWPHSKINLFTNGINLLKYYNSLPLASVKEVHISLDGTRNVHMERRYIGYDADCRVYDDIISGIKKLLNDGVAVKVKTVLNKYNYKECYELSRLLMEENISCMPNYSHEYGIVYDFKNPLDLDEEFNNKHDIMKMQEYFTHAHVSQQSLFPSATILFRILNRPINKPSLPKHQRCQSNFLENYYFSCDGNVYFCECVLEGKGIVGTYYPNTSIDNDAIAKLSNRSVMNNDKCHTCAYKFICLGGCPITAVGKDRDINCGIFADENILDNLEFDYQWMLKNAETE